MNIVELDFETFGSVELRGQDSVGVYNYMTHRKTRILMAGYRINGGEVKLWQVYKEDMPLELYDVLTDPKYKVLAYNSTFERYGLRYHCGIDVPISLFIDPQVYSRSLSMPGKLEIDCEVLDLPKNLTKDSRGKELIDLFCMPHKVKTKKGEPERYVDFNNITHPDEWEEFCEYCKQDVIAEGELLRRQQMLGVYPESPFERKLWEFDQMVNDRGMPVDMDFVRKAYKLATESKRRALESQNKITGLANANSRDQLLPWVKARGYPFNTLRSDTVKAVLKDPDVKLTDECREVLKARNAASSTAYQKLDAIMRQVSSDGRLRNQFLFLGSPRAGRWAGNAVQLHNMARPMVLGKCDENPDGYDFEKEEVLAEARQMVYAEDYDGIEAKYKSVLLVIKCLIRTAFVAPGTRVYE